MPRIRAFAAAAGRPVALMQDIQGPRIRTGLLPDGKSVALETGSVIAITSDESTPASATAIHVTYPRFADDFEVGHRILIADGTIIGHGVFEAGFRRVSRFENNVVFKITPEP